MWLPSEHKTFVGLYRLRRFRNISPTLGRCLVFAEIPFIQRRLNGEVLSMYVRERFTGQIEFCGEEVNTALVNNFYENIKLLFLSTGYHARWWVFLCGNHDI